MDIEDISVVKRRKSFRIFLNTILDRTMCVLKIDGCGIWLKSKRGDFLPTAYRGMSPSIAQGLFSKKRDTVLLENQLKKNKAFQVNKPHNSNGRTGHAKFECEERIKSLLTCPILVNGKNIGMLAAFTKNKYHRFTKSERLIFSTLADEIVFGIRTEELTDRVRNDYLNTIKTIAYILEANNKYIYGHSNKVMRYAINIARILKLKKEDMYLIKNAALLHDIGKVGINPEILKKKGRLMPQEWEAMKKHPVIGAELVGRTGFLSRLSPIIRHHHAHVGGGGYPNPELSAKNIPLGSRIISIADAFDAMTSDRPYRKKPLTAEMALVEIRRNAGGQFDAQLAKIFAEYMSTKLNR